MMKSGMKRVGVVLLSGLLILSEVAALTGCKKKSEKGVKTISEDSPWFNASTAEFTDIYKDKKTDYYNNYMRGVYKDGVVFEAEGRYAVPDDFDWEKDSDEPYRFYNLDYFDFSGNLINSVDISKTVSREKQTEIHDITVSYDDVQIKISDTSSGKEKYTASVDLKTGEIGELKEISSGSGETAKIEEMMLFGTWKIGECLVSIYEDWDTRNFIAVISGNGKSKVVDLSAALPSANIFFIRQCLEVSKTEMLIFCPYSNVKFVSLDVETGKVQAKDEELSWIDKSLFDARVSSFDGKSYISDQDGIKRINFETKTLEDVFSYNQCNLNRSLAGRLDLLDVKDDSYVFLDETDNTDSLDFSYGAPKTPKILVLKKSEKNPNAGKKIITAAAVGETYLDYPVCEAIRIYNDTNEEYYIQLDYHYDVHSVMAFSQTGDDADERMGIYYKNAGSLFDQLAIDMASGDGPDIILNAGKIRQIQTEKHLLNLNSYLQGKSGISTEGFFSNVIDAVKVDGNLLYMPVGFTVSGIPVKQADIRNGQIGFTYEEYAKYVDEISTKGDPMVDTRLGILSLLYPYVSGQCIQGKDVNFDNESFRSLCEYVKYNVPDNHDPDIGLDGTATYRGIGSFFSENQYLSSKVTLLGFPSADGSGPAISVDTSIGISASAPSTIADGAWEFIKSCMSDDIQDLVARNDCNPMSRSVFDSTAQIALKNYNWSDQAQGMFIDETAIDTYRKIIESASVIDSADPTILSVINEELPPYFLDQKSLDDVLAILKNRVTTIINERSQS